MVHKSPPQSVSLYPWLGLGKCIDGVSDDAEIDADLPDFVDGVTFGDFAVYSWHRGRLERCTMLGWVASTLSRGSSM